MGLIKGAKVNALTRMQEFAVMTWIMNNKEMAVSNSAAVLANKLTGHLGFFLTPANFNSLRVEAGLQVKGIGGYHKSSLALILPMAELLIKLAEQLGCADSEVTEIKELAKRCKKRT